MKFESAALLTIIASSILVYFAYSAYWLAVTVPWIANITTNPAGFTPPTGFLVRNPASLTASYVMEYSGFAGLILRLLGAAFGLVAFAHIAKEGAGSFSRHKGKVSAALLLTGVYYITLAPIVYFLLNYSALPTISNNLLSLNQIIQILLVATFLIHIGLKVRKESFDVRPGRIWTRISLASAAYTIGVLIVYLSKWAEMMAVDPYLFSALSVRIIGFLNTVLVQTLAVAFAVTAVCSTYIMRLQSKTSALWGMALIFLGLHTVIYTYYCAFIVGIPRFIAFGELWHIPLIILGAYLIQKRT